MRSFKKLGVAHLECESTPVTWFWLAIVQNRTRHEEILT